MLKIPDEVQNRYNEVLKQKKIKPELHGYYLKWLRFYLDFCDKYDHLSAKSVSLDFFQRKLQDKNQNELQRDQAGEAVRLYYLCLEVKPDKSEPQSRLKPAPVTQVKNKVGSDQDRQPQHPSLSQERVRGQSVNFSNNVIDQPLSQSTEAWDMAIKKLSDEIAVRHYSPKTFKSYSLWAQKLRYFTAEKPPEQLTPEDVKKFLTSLAVEQKVSASAQNQAFNGLLFFFRHVLGKEFGKIDGVVRAKRKPYIPVVLSRREVDLVIENLRYPYDLVVKMLYGCGLRLSECMKLRVSNFNFDHGILTVHDGKGQKDRTMPLPRSIEPELKEHLRRVINLHQQDLDNDYDGAFVPGALEKKYKRVGQELPWQWFFPAKTLTYVKADSENRRYHLHETHVQKAIKRAVKKSKLIKRASAHTFRHSFASHLLQANYDIHTIQKLLGHSDVRTTMIYIQTVPSQTIKEARSPLDMEIDSGTIVI